MPHDFAHEVRMSSIKFDHVRVFIKQGRFTGPVELRRVVSDGLWDLVAIVDCENADDAALLTQIAAAQA